MTTNGSRRRILFLPFGVAATIMLFASAAWACSIFVGVYEVRGHASTESVKGVGQSWNGCQPGTCMKNMIHGQTAVSSAQDDITVQAYPEPGVANNRLPDGEYYVTWLNGFTYRSHKVWAVDCMFLGGELERPPQADPGETGEGITVLGFVNVVGGEIVDADGKPTTVTFDLPDGELTPTTETGGINFKKGESSSCIASSANNPNDTWGGGQWGNSVPITVL